MAFEEAAAVCDGFYQGLGHLKAASVGKRTGLLVYGASGSCGTAAVQLGKRRFGAHVTAVCNTKNVELVRSLGADEVIDYLNEDFTKRGEKYDVILDAVGKHSYFRSRRALEPHGLFVATDRLYNFPLAFLTRVAKKRVVFTCDRPTERDVLLAEGAARSGKVPRRRRSRVSAGGRDRGHEVRGAFQKTGNVVLTV